MKEMRCEEKLMAVQKKEKKKETESIMRIQLWFLDFADFYARLRFIIKRGRKSTASKAILSCRRLLWLCDMQVLRKSCFKTNTTSFQNAVNQETESPLAVTEHHLLTLWNALFSSTTES